MKRRLLGHLCLLPIWILLIVFVVMNPPALMIPVFIVLIALATQGTILLNPAPKYDGWNCIIMKEGTISNWPPVGKAVLALHSDGTMFEAVVQHDGGCDTPNAREPAYDYWYDPHRDEVLDDDQITHWRILPRQPFRQTEQEL